MTTIAHDPIWSEQAPHQIALEALQRFQWSVFPLDEEKRPPQIGDAHPNGQPKRLGWKRYQTRRASPQEILSWQHIYNPPAWAVITGVISNIVIIDFDGAAGQETRLRLGLTDPHVLTGSGGHHVYFHHPGWHVPTLNSKTSVELGKRWPGLDIRADGGYAAFCGHNAHGPYRWLRSPEREALSLLPDELRHFLGLLTPPDTRTINEPASQPAPPATPAVPVQTLLTRALRLIEEDGKGRNDSGFWLACQLRDNGYSQDAAKGTICEYVARVPKKNTKGQIERYTLEEALASVNSAFSEAARDAWTIISPASSGTRGNGADASPTTAMPEHPTDLPTIIVSSEQLREVVDQALEAILCKERSSPSLFIQAARLVRLVRNEHRRPLLLQMGGTEVKELLTHCAQFYRLRKLAGGAYEKYPVSPPNELAEQILARQAQPPYLPFPALTAIIETPVMRPDGSLLDQAGYDARTHLYYASHMGMDACTVPRNPSMKEREEALALLYSLIGEFPYVSDADRANALGLLLTPILRPAITRHVPLALIDAPKQGTGKGLLSDLVSIIATGKSAAILTMSESEEELQKLITALLIEGTSIITIDNIAGRLQSRHLDAVLTSDMWRGRILGASKTVLVPQRATWLATGNNIKLGGDLARRCYRIRLDAKVSRPYLRKGFTHSDLAGWALEHRGELIGALLTLARAWYAAGKPQYAHLPALGTFSGWVNVIGGILEHAGVQGFLSNVEQLYDDADEDSTQWEAFFQAWHQTFGAEWIPLATVVHEITTSNDAGSCAGDAEEHGKANLGETLPGALQIALTEKPRSFPIRLGKALERLVDTCFGKTNLRLERGRDAHRKVNLWRILAVGAGGSAISTQENHICTAGNILQRKGWNNLPHPPQTQPAQNGSTGLGSDTSTISPLLACENTVAPPAKGPEREAFDL